MQYLDVLRPLQPVPLPLQLLVQPLRLLLAPLQHLLVRFLKKKIEKKKLKINFEFLLQNSARHQVFLSKLELTNP